MATINGARAIGAAHRVGSIEVGKRADIVIHGGDRPEWHPRADPVTSVIYAAQTSGIKAVLIDGRVVVRDSHSTLIDVGDLLNKVDAAARDLTRRMGVVIENRWPLI